MRRVVLGSAGACLPGALSLVGCGEEPLSVPYDELYVPCVSDEDCPREAPECYTHRFYTAPSRESTIEFRQCSRACSTDRDCRDGTLENGDDGDIPVVVGLCLFEDESAVYDVLAGTHSGHCVDAGRGFDPTLPECPTHGTVDTEIFTGSEFTPLCLPAPLEP